MVYRLFWFFDMLWLTPVFTSFHKKGSSDSAKELGKAQERVVELEKQVRHSSLRNQSVRIYTLAIWFYFCCCFCRSDRGTQKLPGAKKQGESFHRSSDQGSWEKTKWSKLKPRKSMFMLLSLVFTFLLHMSICIILNCLASSAKESGGFTFFKSALASS